MIVNSILGSAARLHPARLSLEAGAIYTACTALGEFFYHTNVRTPRWVGFVFQRPEMHRIHHQYGRHTNNYGDIVWWDMLFGTYENPQEFDGHLRLRRREGAAAGRDAGVPRRARGCRRGADRAERAIENSTALLIA